MKSKRPDPNAIGRGRGSGIGRSNCTTTLLQLKVPRQPPDGLVRVYRQPRSPAKQLRAGAEALRRIVLLSEQGRAPILPKELHDVAAWLERGCLPK
jgi:hypothetical protein